MTSVQRQEREPEGLFSDTHTQGGRSRKTQSLTAETPPVIRHPCWVARERCIRMQSTIAQPSHIRNCIDRSPILPCVRRSRKSFAVQSRPIRAHSAAKPSRSANSAPRKFWSYAPTPPLARCAAQRETQTMLYSQCTPR